MREELPLHDATFDGLMMQGDDCRLFFTKPDGRGCEVILGGVDALQIDGFREGNIIVFFGTITHERPNALNVFLRLYTAPHKSASAEFHAKHQELVEAKVGAITDGQLILVEMEPAIGASLVASCRDVRFTNYGGGS